GIDPPVALFTLLVSLLCGIVMGFAPAVHSRIARLHTALKESSGRVSGGKLPQRFRNVMVVAEIALTLVLLVGAGLLIRSFQRLNALNPGFDADHLLCLTVGLPRASGGSDISTREILDRIR